MSSTAVHVRRLIFNLAPMRPRQGGTTSTFTLRVTKPSIISDGHARHVTPDTQTCSIFTFGTVHSATPEPLLSPLVPHVLSAACPLLSVSSRVRRARDPGGTDETLDVPALPFPGDIARRSN